MAEDKKSLPLFSGWSFAYFTDSVDKDTKDKWVENGGSVVYGITTTSFLGKPTTDLYSQDSTGHNFELTWLDQLDWKDVLVFAKEGDVGLDETDDRTLGFPLKQPDGRLIIFSSDWIHQCIIEGQTIPLRDWIVHANRNLDVEFLETASPSRYIITKSSKTVSTGLTDTPFLCTDETGTLPALSAHFTRPPDRSEHRRSISLVKIEQPRSIQVALAKHLLKLEIMVERMDKTTVEALLLVSASDDDEEDCHEAGAVGDDALKLYPDIPKSTFPSFLDNDFSAMLHLDIKSISASSPLASDDLTASGPSGMTQSCKDILTEQSKDHDVDLAFPLALPTSTLATVIVNPPIEWYVYKASNMSGGKFQFLIGGEGVGVFDLDGWTRGGMWCVEEKMATPVVSKKPHHEAYRMKTLQPTKGNSRNDNHRHSTNAKRRVTAEPDHARTMSKKRRQPGHDIHV